MQKKIIAVFLSFIVLFFTLFLRIYGITLDERLLETGLSSQTVSVTFDKTRGNIYDRKLKPLVNTEKEYAAVGVMTIENQEELLSSPFLNRDEAAALKLGKPFSMKCSSPKLDIKGVQVYAVDKRYSENQMLNHIIGYVDSQNRGVSGIEAGYDGFLSEVSRKSKAYFEVDGQGRSFKAEPTDISLAQPTTAGVVLTIDSRIQQICEEVGGKLLEKGAIVVMEPDTGKLLAVASFPDYEIGDLQKAVNDSENTPMINRAFYPYSVGSCFKIVTAAAALEAGIPESFLYECVGKTDVGGQTFHCHNQNGHGEIEMEEAFGFSCNPYFIELSKELDNEVLINTASDMSFGKAFEPAYGLSAKSGYLQTAEDLFNPAEKANMSFGQGKLTASPLQLALMMSTVVNGGKTPIPSLIEGYTENGVILSEREEAKPPLMSVSKRTAEIIREMLVFAVNDMENQKAKPRYVTAGGKTGTAQTGRMNDDGTEILQGWFCGFFPAEEPRYVVVVLSENAKSGNQDASPVFKEIADRLYQPRKLPDELKTKIEE